MKYISTHSPDELTHIMCNSLGVSQEHRVLEPSAGKGGMVKIIQEYTNDVVAVELSSDNYAELVKNTKVTSYKQDFLRLTPDSTALNGDPFGYFDRIVMCPPKDSVEHIQHAIKFLKPTGKLMALVQDQNISDIGTRPWTVVKTPKEFEFEYCGISIPCSIVLYAELIDG